jgi:hypothetical protein
MMSDYEMGKDFAKMGMNLAALGRKSEKNRLVINNNARVLKAVIENQDALRKGLLGLCVSCFCFGVAGLIQDRQLSALEERVSKLENEKKNRTIG